MNHRPYSAYRGRRSWGRRILIALAVILAVALVLAVAAAVILPNYIVYTDEGPRVVLPLFGGSRPSALPTQASSEEPSREPAVVVETPTPTPAPTPAPTPTPTPMEPRREPTQGLVTLSLDQLADGGAASALRADQGAIFDMTSADLAETEGILDANRALPYSVAYLAPDWSLGSGPDGAQFKSGLEEKCKTLAGLGFDEILFSAPTEDAWEAAGEVYALVRAALDDIGYQGRLSGVCRRGVFTDDALMETLLPAVAGNLDRVYASRQDSWSGLHLYRLLEGDDERFRGTTSDIVTEVRRPQQNANYPWAVLPES